MRHFKSPIVIVGAITVLLLVVFGAVMAAVISDDETREAEQRTTLEHPPPPADFAIVIEEIPTRTPPVPVGPSSEEAPPEPTIVPPPVVDEPVLPLAPPCGTWASQDEATAWLEANSANYDTSNIDTNGDGIPCTLDFRPPPTPTSIPSPVQTPSTQSAPSTSGGCVPGYIVQRESRGSYTALNPSSGAGGKYQFMPSTWNAIARVIAPQWVGTPPHTAPPSVQDRFACYLWDGGNGAYHWSVG